MTESRFPIVASDASPPVRRRRDAPFFSHKLVPGLLGGVAVLAIVAAVDGLSNRDLGFSSHVEEALLVGGSSYAAAEHLRYTEAGTTEAERTRFHESRREVQVIIDWDMTVEDLLNLYGLRNQEGLEDELGGPGRMLRRGDSFSILLN